MWCSPGFSSGSNFIHNVHTTLSSIISSFGIVSHHSLCWWYSCLCQYHSRYCWTWYFQVTRLFDCHLTIDDHRQAGTYSQQNGIYAFWYQAENAQILQSFPHWHSRRKFSYYLSNIWFLRLPVAWTAYLFCEKLYPSEKVSYTSVIYNFDLSFDHYISSVRQSVFYHISGPYSWLLSNQKMPE